MADEVAVLSAGLGQLQISGRPDQRLVAYGLGSCIGLVVWGWRGLVRVVALAHVVMPHSRGRPEEDPAKFADTAVPEAIRMLVAAGCGPSGLQAVIAGGACMFPGTASLGEIGAANAARVQQELGRVRIPLRAAEIGGRRGRTLTAAVGSGRIECSTAGGAQTVLWPGGPERHARPGAQGGAL